MKWRVAKDRYDNPLKNVISCEEGYRVARFTVDGQHFYRASLAGQFLHLPVADPGEAKAVCERHHAITGGQA